VELNVAGIMLGQDSTLTVSSIIPFCTVVNTIVTIIAKFPSFQGGFFCLYLFLCPVKTNHARHTFKDRCIQWLYPWHFDLNLGSPGQSHPELKTPTGAGGGYLGSGRRQGADKPKNVENAFCSKQRKQGK